MPDTVEGPALGGQGGQATGAWDMETIGEV